MSKWPMRGHFGHLHFKTFLMTSRTPQCEVFWALLLNSKHSGVPEDSKSPTLGVWVSSSHLAKVGLWHKCWNFMNNESCNVEPSKIFIFSHRSNVAHDPPKQHVGVDTKFPTNPTWHWNICTKHLVIVELHVIIAINFFYQTTNYKTHLFFIMFNVIPNAIYKMYYKKDNGDSSQVQALSCLVKVDCLWFIFAPFWFQFMLIFFFCFV
jgi:hypothetical protein